MQLNPDPIDAGRKLPAVPDHPECGVFLALHGDVGEHWQRLGELISAEGLGMELPEPLPMLANIAVQSEENTALGVVRHSRELSSGIYRIGVQLHHIVRKDLDLEKASAESGWMGKLGARFGRKKAERPKGWS